MPPITIKFKENTGQIEVPSDFGDLNYLFKRKFIIDESLKYIFYFFENESNKIIFEDTDNLEFQDKLSLLQKQEEPVIYVEEIEEEEENSKLSKTIKAIKIKNSLLQRNKNFINEIKKYEEIIKEIIFDKQNTNLDFDDEEKPKNKINNINEIDLGIQNSFESSPGASKNKKEMNKSMDDLINKINELEKNYEELKKKNKINYDNMTQKLNEMKKAYEEKEKIKDKEIDSLKKIIEKYENNGEINELKKDNEIKKKIIENYESNNKKLLELFEAQKTFIENIEKEYGTK